MKPERINWCVNCKRVDVFSINGKESSVKLCIYCTDRLFASYYTAMEWWMRVVRQYENK